MVGVYIDNVACGGELACELVEGQGVECELVLVAGFVLGVVVSCFVVDKGVVVQESVDGPVDDEIRGIEGEGVLPVDVVGVLKQLGIGRLEESVGDVVELLGEAGLLVGTEACVVQDFFDRGCRLEVPVFEQGMDEGTAFEWINEFGCRRNIIVSSSGLGQSRSRSRETEICWRGRSGRVSGVQQSSSLLRSVGGAVSFSGGLGGVKVSSS